MLANIDKTEVLENKSAALADFMKRVQACAPPPANLAARPPLRPRSG